MFHAFNLHIQISTPPYSSATPTISLKECQEVGKKALQRRVIRGIEFVSNQTVVIEPFDFINDSVRVLPLEQAYYYLQGLLDGAKIELRKVECGAYSD
jgi:hypothetical protein